MKVENGGVPALPSWSVLLLVVVDGAFMLSPTDCVRGPSNPQQHGGHNNQTRKLNLEMGARGNYMELQYFVRQNYLILVTSQDETDFWVM
jgi:hypothetical protein